MSSRYDREKLVNAIVFFARNTESLGITKLCKLLYFLDFEHYKVTGRSVTGSEYRAWPKGPVPTELWKEFKRGLEPDLAAKITVSPTGIGSGKTWQAISATADFDPAEFTKREIGLLKRLAAEYRRAYADDMVEATHLERLPWHQVYEIEGKHDQPIPYELAVREEHREIIEELAREHEEVVKNFDL